MPTYPQIIFDSAASFRNWLSENHDKSTGVSLVFYKAHTGKRTFSYPQALDEALCFGWIDSTVRSLDDEKYCQVFTPRTNIKNWSDVNKLKVLRLIEEDRMTNAGLNKIEEWVKTGKLSWKPENISNLPKPIPEMPQFFKSMLVDNEPAFENFNKMAASHKRTYLNWILSAKRDETQTNRATKAVEMILKNYKPGVL